MIYQDEIIFTRKSYQAYITAQKVIYRRYRGIDVRLIQWPLGKWTFDIAGPDGAIRFRGDPNTGLSYHAACCRAARRVHVAIGHTLANISESC